MANCRLSVYFEKTGKRTMRTHFREAAKMRLSCACILLLATCTLAGRPQRPVVFYVSPTGDDSAQGTEDKPFATLKRAQQAVRELVARGLDRPVRVVIREGVYRLEEPLTFGPEDSGTKSFSITYEAAPGATVVLSGGRRISGWKKPDGRMWTAYCPELQAGSWRFRELYVEGVRVQRARAPEGNARFQLKAVEKGPNDTITAVVVPREFARACYGESGCEIVINGNWAINRKLIDSADPETGRLVLKKPHVPAIRWNRPGAGRWSFIENVKAFLKKPGQWYADLRTGTIYLLDPGVDMARATVVAPALKSLVVIKGTPERPVRNLHFIGLSFMHTTWPLPPFGYHGIQACHYAGAASKLPGRRWPVIEAAVFVSDAVNVSFRSGRFAHLGGCGVYLADGCRSCEIVGNRFYDIGANGIMVGGPNDVKRAPCGNRIENNYIHNIGVEFFGAVAVWVGYAAETTVAHNLIHDTPYTGISVGWQWNPEPTVCRGNIIEYNHVYNTMKELADGGCIYTLGFQPGTIIRGNLLHDAGRSPYAHGAPNNGFFIDEGSKGFVFEKNVVYHTSAGYFRFNQCKPEWHTWRDNVWGLPSDLPKKGRGAFFGNGRSSFEVPHRNELDPPQFTLEAWVYMGVLPFGEDNRWWIAGKNSNEWTEGHYALIVRGRGVGAYLNIGGGKENAVFATVPGWVELNSWQHVAVTYDGNTLIVYLNGRPGKAVRIARKRRSGNGTFTIGGRPDGYERAYFRGLIDDVRLYNRALSRREIAARASARTPEAAEKLPHLPGLVAWWNFAQNPPVALSSEQQRIVREIKARAGLEPAYRERLLSEKKP